MRRNPVALILAFALLVPVAFAAGYKYPKTATGDVAEDYHGTIVKDPYRWLEDDVRTSDDVADWVKAQNEITFGYHLVRSRAASCADRPAHRRTSPD